MRKRGRIVLLAVALGLGTILFIALWPSREPSYEGKLLSQWVDSLIDTNRPSDLASEKEQEVVCKAVRQMATNAVPFLVKWVSCDWPVHSRLFRAIPRGFRHKCFRLSPAVLHRQSYLRRGAAGKALIFLGPEASSAFPALSRLLMEGKMFGPGGDAHWILREIGEPARPTLIATITNNYPMRRRVIYDLGHLGPKGLSAVPTLKTLVNDPDPGMRAISVEAIEAITGERFTNTPAATLR
jgi:hypothetical protein